MQMSNLLQENQKMKINLNNIFLLLISVLVTLLLNGCAVIGQRTQVTIYPNNNLDYTRYKYYCISGELPSAKGTTFTMSNAWGFMEFSFKDKGISELIETKPQKHTLFIKYKCVEGSVFPYIYGHFDTSATATKLAEFLFYDSITKKTLMTCKYTRGYLTCNFINNEYHGHKVFKRGFDKGVQLLKDVQQQKNDHPDQSFPSKITVTVY